MKLSRDTILQILYANVTLNEFWTNEGVYEGSGIAGIEKAAEAIYYAQNEVKEVAEL